MRVVHRGPGLYSPTAGRWRPEAECRHGPVCGTWRPASRGVATLTIPCPRCLCRRVPVPAPRPAAARPAALKPRPACGTWPRGSPLAGPPASENTNALPGRACGRSAFSRDGRLVRHRQPGWHARRVPETATSRRSSAPAPTRPTTGSKVVRFTPTAYTPDRLPTRSLARFLGDPDAPARRRKGRSPSGRRCRSGTGIGPARRGALAR